MNKGREKGKKKGKKRDENEKEGGGEGREKKKKIEAVLKNMYTLCSQRVPFSEQTTVRLQGRVQAMGACAIQAKGDFCFLLPYHNVSS